jgi:hypothetical protein
MVGRIIGDDDDFGLKDYDNLSAAGLGLSAYGTRRL